MTPSPHSYTESKPCRRWFFAAFCCVLSAVVYCQPGFAAESAIATTGAKLLSELGDTSVTVRLKVVYSIVGAVGHVTAPRTRDVSAQGTVVNDKGLILVSLGQIQPSVMSPAGTPVPAAKLSFDQVTIRLPSGEIIGGKVLATFQEEGVGFIVPAIEVAGRYFRHIDPRKGAIPTILKSYFEIIRAPTELQSVCAIRMIDVIGLVPAPTHFFLTSESNLGSPVVDEKGRLIGVGLRPAWVARTPLPGLVPAEQISKCMDKLDASAKAQ